MAGSRRTLSPGVNRTLSPGVKRALIRAAQRAKHEHHRPERRRDRGPGARPSTEARQGVGAGATAVVSAAPGVVALTGTWTGRVAAERETPIGRIQTSGGAGAAQRISEIYGDAWHTTALVNGVFTLLALLVGVVVLVRPAFDVPSDEPRPARVRAGPRGSARVRAVALGGVALGVLGLLISVGMYFDLFGSLPTAGG